MKLLLLKVNQYLLFLILITVVLYYGRPVLIPFFFAVVLAMLMAPVCRFLDARGWKRALSCTLAVMILLIAFTGILAVLIGQVAAFGQDMELISTKFKELWTPVQQRIEEWLNIAPEKQDSMIKNQVQQMSQSPGAVIGKMMGSLSGMLTGLAMTLVFTFLFLFHKEKYEQFFLKTYQQKDKKRIQQLLQQITKVSQQYLTGRLLSMLFLFVLYVIALLIIGIKNALLLSAIASLLTIIPYIGAIVGSLIPVLSALVTEDSMQPAIWTGIVIVVIQTIDNYFIEPNVIGGEVRLSALATIAAIFIGGILWGVIGMILFIPLFGIAKIVFDHVQVLQPYGFLIGDQTDSPSSKIKDWVKKKFG